MKIVVCIKQVPDTSGKVAVNPDGTLNRASMLTIINPDDKNAIEEALKLKDETGCKVIAVTMGPPPAEGMLREVMAMGVDEGILVSAREFGGSDTYATSQILAAALTKLGLEKDDIVFCGRQAIDGDTAQVGPQTAERLGLPQITYVDQIIELTPEKITVKKALEEEEQILTSKMPCVLTTLSGMNKPRYMNCVDIVDSFDKPVNIMTFDDLDLDLSVVGLAGSPTKVHATFTKEVSAETKTYELSAQETAELIAKTLKEKQLITK